MKFFIFGFILLFTGILNVQTKAKTFYLDENDIKCALLEIDGYIDYQKSEKSNVKRIEFYQANMTGSCANKEIFAELKFGFPTEEMVVATFTNENNVSTLASLRLSLPDKSQINSTVGFELSNSMEYFFCTRPVDVNLAPNVRLHTKSVKVQVFNVEDKFSNGKQECSAVPITTAHIPSLLSTTEASTFTTEQTKPTTIPTTAATTRTTERTTASTERTTASTERTTASTERTTASTEKTAVTRPQSTGTAKTTTSNSTVTSSHVTKTSIHPQTTPSYDPKFYVKGNNGTVCLLMKSKIDVTITYKTLDKKDRHVSFKLSSAVTFGGICKADLDVLELSWTPPGLRSILSDDSRINLNFTFVRHQKTAELSTITLAYNLNSTAFPNAAKTGHHIDNVTLKDDYVADLGGNYYCDRKLTFSLGSTSKISLMDLRFEAFRTTKTEIFSKTVKTCTRDPMVAIIVGVVLAVFLIIVLIVFIIFRVRANRKNTYQEI